MNLLDLDQEQTAQQMGVSRSSVSLIRYRKKVGLDAPVRLTGWGESQRLGVYLCRAEVFQESDLEVSARAKFMRMP